MEIKSFIYNSYTYEGYTIMNISNDTEVSIKIMKMNNNRATPIAQAKRERKYLPKPTNDELNIEMLIVPCFKDVTCVFCNDTTSVLLMSETEIGYGCTDCLDKSDPPISFVPLNLEKYIEKEYKI